MWSEPILHVDMDSFFVEVERLGNPALRGLPVAVGGTGPRGVIASASYEARRHGVRSAQPTATALRLCPELIVVPPAHNKYGQTSEGVFAIFRSITPLVEGLSLDEAFLDISGLRRHYPGPLEVGERVRSRLRDELGLPASVGVAANKLLAKLASESAKPDGIRHISADIQLAFLHSLEVEALPGVGPATLAALARLGVATVGDLAETPESSLVSAVGPTTATQLRDLARGIDPRLVTPDTEAKSISVEETYQTDLEGRALVETALLAHAHRLASRLRRAGLRARTITLKVRYDDFQTISRSRTSELALDEARALFRVGIGLLEEVELGRPVRLLGLAGSLLQTSDEARQLDLETSEEWTRVEDAMESVRRRFGDDSITAASLLE